MGRSFGRFGITSEKRDRRGGVSRFNSWEHSLCGCVVQIMMTKQIDSGVGLNIYEDYSRTRG